MKLIFIIKFFIVNMKNKLYLKNAENKAFIKIQLIHSEIIENEITKISIPYNLQILLDNFPENTIKSINDISYEFQTDKNQFLYLINNTNKSQKHFLIINAYYISLFFIQENFCSITIPIEFNDFSNGKKWYYLTDQNKNICIKLLIQIKVKINNIDLKINKIINRNMNLSNYTKTTNTSTEPDTQSLIGKNTNFLPLNSNSLNNINFTKLNSNQNNIKSITNEEIKEQNHYLSNMKLIDNDCDNSSTIYNDEGGFYEVNIVSLKKKIIEKSNNNKNDFLNLKKNDYIISKSELLEEIEIYEKNTINLINDMMFKVNNIDEIELNNKMNNAKNNILIASKKSKCAKFLDTPVKYKKNKEKLVLRIDKFLINNSKISTNKLFNYKINKRYSCSKINKTYSNIQSKSVNDNLINSILKQTKDKKNHNSININKKLRTDKIKNINKNKNKKIYFNNSNIETINKENLNSNNLSKNLLFYSQRNINFSKSSKKLIKNEQNDKICQMMLNYHNKEKKKEIFFFNWKKNDMNMNQFNKCGIVANKSTDSYKKVNFTNSFIYLTSVNEKKNKKIFKHNFINKDKNHFSQKQIKINKKNQIDNNVIKKLNEKRKKTKDKIKIKY